MGMGMAKGRDKPAKEQKKTPKEKKKEKPPTYYKERYGDE